MNVLPYLFAPLALLPALAQVPGAEGSPAKVLEQGHRAAEQRQVSIEQHVIIRIAPSRADPRARMGARLPPPEPLRKRFKEKKLDGCVPVSSIAGITPAADNRVLLLMRDRRVLSAAVEKSCHAEEFYSGAYVERSADGQLCPKRDRLQSRTGADCEVVRLNRLVARD